MLVTNQRLDKLAAARVDFVNRGMLDPKNPKAPGIVLEAVVGGESRDEVGDEDNEDEAFGAGPSTRRNAQVAMVTGNVTLARTCGMSFFCIFFALTMLAVRRYPRSLEVLAGHINHPQLPELTRRFLFDQLNKNSDITSNDVDLEDCPMIEGNISVFHSAIASYFSPSDDCGRYGMCRERIRSCPLWRGKSPRRDCVFVVEDEDKPGMRGMNVAQIQLFFSFAFNAKEYQCALVNCFSRIGRSRDTETGMWKVCPDIRQGLLPIFGENFLPINFDYSDSLIEFACYFVNHFADHHSHEIIF